MIIIEYYCIIGTFLNTKSTGNTTVFAYASCGFSVIRRATPYGIAFTLFFEDNKLIRASLYAFSAAHTASWVNNSNTVYNRYAVIIAYGGTVSEAVTACRAFALTAIEFFHSAAASTSYIGEFILGSLTITVTTYKGYFPFGFNRLNSHNSADFNGNIFTAGLTEISRSKSLSYRLGIALTARIAASAAVCTRESFAYFFYSFIGFHKQKLRRNSQQNTD